MPFFKLGTWVGSRSWEIHCCKWQIGLYGIWARNSCFFIKCYNSFLVQSTDSLRKKFRPRSRPTQCMSWSGSKLLDMLIVFLIEYFEKVNFEKKITKEWKNTGAFSRYHRVQYSAPFPIQNILLFSHFSKINSQFEAKKCFSRILVRFGM